MVTRFADAVYWIALLNAKDSLHHRAVSLSRSPDHTVVVTTEMVLTEVLNAFAARGDRLREAAAELVLHLKGDENVRVVPQTSLQFDAGLQLYRTRRDKTWSQTDCVSFQIMEREGIAEALTYDLHFEQAGFKALMRY